MASVFYSRNSILINKTACALALIAMISACTGPSDPPGEILARVGEQRITRADFLRRAEFTLRPPYCRDNSNLAKQIIFNSLVAEKLMAMEAANSDAFLAQTEIANFLRGRQEQAMRRLYYYRTAYERSQPTDSTLRKQVQAAGYQFIVSYIQLPQAAAEAVSDSLSANHSTLAAATKHLLGDREPAQREVTYLAPDVHPAVHRYLYEELPKRGTVSPPIGIAENRAIVLQVEGVRQTYDLNPEERRRQVDDVAQFLRQRQAAGYFRAHVADLMRGKQLQLNEVVFRQVVATLAPIYLRQRSDLREAYKRQFWRDQSDAAALDTLAVSPEALLASPLFTYDGGTWTVADFELEMQKHPLVFRADQLSGENFAAEMRLAIADLMRDREISQAAYAADLDQDPAIRQEYAIWRDNLLATFSKIQLLISAGKSQRPLEEQFREVLNPHIRQLRERYRDEIEINVEMLKDIELTRTDMMVMHQREAFPIVVPAFPQLTDMHEINYGKIMKTE
jgi:hypothetical protein